MDTILLILKLVPTLIDAIVAIEKQISGAGFGAQKLEAVRAMLQAIDTSYTKYWNQISGVITVLVGLFNKTGAFKTSATTQAQAVLTGSNNAQAVTQQAHV